MEKIQSSHQLKNNVKGGYVCPKKFSAASASFWVPNAKQYFRNGYNQKLLSLRSVIL